MSSLSTIPGFYSNKSVFITGGTGFIGKVILEKLLRSCPDIKNIYLLMREKKKRSLETRLKEMLDIPLFDVVRCRNPDDLMKVKAVGGDVRELNLGLSPEDREVLIHEVNVIFHVAASVRFDDSLTDAVLLNTRGTREVVALALETKNLDVFVHVSTTYCNTDKDVIEEKLYPPHADWRKTIEVAEKIDRNVLNTLTEKYIHPLPNTYTFTKSLAEHVVYDLCQGRIPAVIYRPSVVLAALEEPLPGWLDTLNGPMAVTTGCATGVVRIMYGDPNVFTDYVPVDLLVKSMIISSWKQATFQNDTLKKTLNVYNGSNCDINPEKQIGNLNKCIESVLTMTPYTHLLWYPNYRFTRSFFEFYIKMIFYQLLPAVFFDLVLRVLGKKPMLVKLQRKIYSATLALSYFSHGQWVFRNKNCLDLDKHLAPSDVDSFMLKEDEFDLDEYCAKLVRGIKMYVLQEDDDLKTAKKKLNRMKIAYIVFNLLWYFGLIWFVFVKMDIVSTIGNAGRNSWVYLTED